MRRIDLFVLLLAWSLLACCACVQATDTVAATRHTASKARHLDAEEGALIISHLRGRVHEIGADDIWDNATHPELRCNLDNSGSEGCTEAPACDNVGQCTSKTMRCTQTRWTACRGCFLRAPGCPSGFSCNRGAWPNPTNGHVHQGGGEFCNVACCVRVGTKEHTRTCPKTGCESSDSSGGGQSGGDDSDSGALGAIVGGIVGGLALVICAVGLFCWNKRSSGQQQQPMQGVQYMQQGTPGFAHTAAANFNAQPVQGVPAAGTFCVGCGAPRDDGKFCPSCGKPYD